MGNRKKINIAGFTIVELLIATAIFLIVSLGLAFSLSAILKSYKADFIRTKAIFLGKSKAEQLHNNQPYGKFTKESGTLSEEYKITYETELRKLDNNIVQRICKVYYNSGVIEFDY